MDMQLHDRTALVTGSSSGIGAVTAEALAAEGCRVLVHGRRRDAVDAQVERIRANGGRAEGVLGDVADADDTDRLLDEVAGHGPVDVLVANAGPFSEHTFDQATDADWSDSFERNEGGRGQPQAEVSSCWAARSRYSSSESTRSA